jgi:hypothetical protein
MARVRGGKGFGLGSSKSDGKPPHSKLGPAAGDDGGAVGAVPCPEAIFEDIVPGTADEEFATVGAVGMGGFRKNIAFVDVVKTNFESNFSRTMQSLRRSGGLILQLEIGMKSGEVQGDLWTQIGEDPLGEFAGFCRIVVEGRDHEVGELEPDVGFVFEPEEGVQHGLEVGERDFAVEIFGEGFQVNIGGVDVVVNVVKGLAGDVAVRNHDGLQTERPGGFANVDDIFAPDRGLVVSESNGAATVFFCEERYVLRSKVARINLILMGLGNIPILAEETAHVAASSAHAEDAGARQEMVQGLLFYGVNLKRGWCSVAEGVEFTVVIGANVAEAGLAVADMAVTGTEKTVDAVVGFGLPPERFVERGRRLQNLEGGHTTKASAGSIRRLEERREWSGGAVLGAAANSGPVREGLQVVAVFPGKAKKFGGVEMLRVLAKEGLKAPLDVRAFPGLQAITGRSEPVKLKEMPHEKL